MFGETRNVNASLNFQKMFFAYQNKLFFWLFKVFDFFFHANLFFWTKIVGGRFSGFEIFFDFSGFVFFFRVFKIFNFFFCFCGFFIRNSNSFDVF